MSRLEDPKRLVETAELGEAMEAARELTISRARIDAGAELLQQKLATLAASGGTTTLLSSLWAKIALLFGGAATVATAALVWYGGQDTVAPAIVEPSRPALIEPDPVALPPVTVEIPEVDDEPPRAPRPPPPKRRPSALQAQLEAFEAAKAAARSGDHSRAIERLDMLETAHPETVLLPEILVLRAELLSRAGRTHEALRDLGRAMDAPSLRGRRAELSRFAGDLWSQAGDCQHAVAAYKRAIALGAEGKQMERAQAGIRACREREKKE
jgi:tetratricopeptide (TPR) repeat protein